MDDKKTIASPLLIDSVLLMERRNAPTRPVRTQIQVLVLLFLPIKREMTGTRRIYKEVMKPAFPADV